MSPVLIVNERYLVFEDAGRFIAAIDRTFNRIARRPNPIQGKRIDFAFILGIYEIDYIYYMVLVTNTSPVSELWDISQITGFEIVPICLNGATKNAAEYLEDSFHLTPLYFSKSVDLSLNAQQQHQGISSREQFVWNFSALQLWSEFGGPNQITREVITGFVGSYRSHDFFYLLVSRRSNKRAGTRFWMRGVDDEGHAANYVETEQVVFRKGKLTSFVQIRGSIPIFWSQNPDLSRTPPIEIDRDPSAQAFARHIEHLTAEYGTVMAISLTDRSGREAQITDMYHTLSEENGGLSFFYFDFHQECRRMRYENVERLLSVLPDLGFFGPTSQQTGVFRTNCIDCLDRTNVVQSKIALRTLQMQLDGYQVGDFRFFNKLWADNADALSLQYAGTPAMKTDYTRKGRRTLFGIMKDGKNSLSRYYVNTLKDGIRQDEYDLLTTAKLPIQPHKNSLCKAVFSFLSLLFSAFTDFVKGDSIRARNIRRNAGLELVNRPLRVKKSLIH